jgi:ABC-2 type transport system ATP-binding protein
VTAIVQLNGVNKSFGTTKAVIDLDLAVPDGSLCGFLGPNGAGKSTTIRMIMSIIHPDSGSMSVLGTTALQAKDRIGYLPEERGVYRKMKVGAFVEYIARLKGAHGHGLRRCVDDWLERIELPDVRNRKCEELSKGMQQKVQFLVAIIHEPELIILDEPFAGLDPVNANVLGSIIDDLHREGRTILFSTHVLHQAERICDRIVMIDQGIKVLDGPIDDIRTQFDARTIELEPVHRDVRLDMIDGVSHVEGVGGDGLVKVRLSDGADAADVLQQIAATIPVRGIQVVRPTLDEIFIDEVLRRRGAEAATSTREELTRA